MGCSTSRIDNEEVVMLCKERKKFIKQAVDQRYALAVAHVGYIHSLKNIGIALRHFAEGRDIPLVEAGTPMLTLPVPVIPEPIALPEKSSIPSPLPPSPQPEPELEPEPEPEAEPEPEPKSLPSSPDEKSPPASYESPRYLRSSGNPSMSYEERPPSPERIRLDYYSAVPQYGMSDIFSTTMPPPACPSASSYSHYNNANPGYPPPPPSPPRNFTWDFFNPFTSLENPFSFHEQRRLSQTSHEDLKQVREEEGIPDLEEDDQREDDVEEEKKEMQVEERTVEAVVPGVDSSCSHTEPKTVLSGSGDGDEVKAEQKIPIVNTGVSGEVVGEQKVEVVKVVDNEIISERKDLAVLDTHRARNLLEVMRDIEDQFIRAYDSGKEVSRMLEASKVNYHSNFTELKEHSAKVLNAITWHRSTSSRSPSFKAHLASSSKDAIAESSSDFVEDCGMISGSHASTLDRLYAWEKKLYDEVKAGERTRICYEKKCTQLRHQDAKGEDPQVVDKTRAAIKDLHTRIRVAIQAVDSVSKRIQKLRDEELQPQLAELLQGLMRMWKVMLESHQTQNQIISEAKSLGSSATAEISNESHRQATIQLENELHKWQMSFSNWISAQKAYVQALNGWLLKCVMQDPETLSRGKVPFSPCRVGAPPVFVICSDWCPAFDKMPEKAVVEGIRSFAVGMHALWVQQDEEQRQKRKADNLARDLDRWVLSDSGLMTESFRKRVEEEKAKHHKVMQQTQQATLNTLQTGLTFIFEALTEFAAASLKTYEQLHTQSERARFPHEMPYIKDV